MNFSILGEMDPKATTTSTTTNNSEKKINNENNEPKKDTISPPKQQQQSATINSNKFFKQESLKQPVNKTKSPLNQNKNNSALNGSVANDKNSFNGHKIFTIASLNPYQNKYFVYKKFISFN